MKLIHFSTEKYWRGGEQQIAYLINELNAAGIENFLICRESSKMHLYAQDHHIAHEAIVIRNSIDPYAIYKLTQILNEQAADFIQLHSSKAHSLALFASPFIKPQSFILHRRVSFPINQSRINKWKYNHPSIKRIVCISNDVRKQVARIVKDDSKLETIYSGIDLSKFSTPVDNSTIKNEFGIPQDHLLVTGVGALSIEKGFDTFIHTANKTLQAFNKVHFLIVGTGNEEIKLKALTEKLKIAPHITFTGFRKDIPAILDSTDVFMLCSKSEGLGTSFIDASASGCALIGTNAGGIPEIIDDSKNGYLQAIDDTEGLSFKLLTVLKNEQLRAEMSKNAKAKAQQFSLKQMGEKYLALYQTLSQ